jgi:hypothetical protein
VLATTGAAAATPASPRAQIRATLEHQLAHWNPADHPAGEHGLHGPGLMKVTNASLSGYVDDNSMGNTYSKVTAQWKVPRVTCTAGVASAVVFWVGLDGWTTSTMERVGTITTCPGNGSTTPVYGSWWQMYPSNPTIQMVGTTVAPTDPIIASVVKSGSTYTLKLTDLRHPANNLTKTGACNCTDQSAEWIAQRQGSSTPLADFDFWVLKNATVRSGSTTGTISTFPDDQVTLVDSVPLVMAQPGPLNATGNEFQDTWVRGT